MVTGAKHVVGLLALLIMANASPLQGGQHNLALNRDFGFDEDHYDRDLVENGPLPEDRGQDLWARALERWIGPTNRIGRLEERQYDPCGCWWCFGLCCCNG